MWVYSEDEEERKGGRWVHGGKQKGINGE